MVRAYWKDEFEHYPGRLRSEVTAPVLNKLGGLLTNPRLYRALAEPASPISFRRLMDKGGIFIANLAKGRLGADSADTLGSMIVATIGMAALSRAGDPMESRRRHLLYVDEFQSFTTLAFATMLPELRKMGIGMVLSHQHTAQIEPEIRHAVLGNVGTPVAFRLGTEGAPVIARELQPHVGEHDLMNLPNHRFYTRLMINGVPSKAFSGQGMATKVGARCA